MSDAALTRAQAAAMEMLRRARAEDPSTDDGLVSSEATVYDGEVAVAWVHWRTAKALRARGLVTFGAYDPDGQEIRLVSA